MRVRFTLTDSQAYFGRELADRDSCLAAIGSALVYGVTLFGQFARPGCAKEDGTIPPEFIKSMSIDGAETQETWHYTA